MVHIFLCLLASRGHLSQIFGIYNLWLVTDLGKMQCDNIALGVTLKASVCYFYQNFNIHTLRCDFYRPRSEGDNAGKIGKMHVTICAQKLNPNRTFLTRGPSCIHSVLKGCWTLFPINYSHAHVSQRESTGF